MDRINLGKHSSTQFNDEMESIHNHLLEMGGLVERQVSDAMQSLLKYDTALATRVLKTEDRVDYLEKKIDEECARVLALRQPAATDLRMLIAVSKCISDLERVGDEAVKVATIAVQLTEAGDTDSDDHNEIQEMGDHVSRMLHSALDAFARFDADLAVEVAIDLQYRTAMRSFTNREVQDPSAIPRVLNLIWTLRSLERVGDHARNICEQIIYLVKGKDVRHISVEQIEREVKGSV